jgi:hypothetical protein
MAANNFFKNKNFLLLSEKNRAKITPAFETRGFCHEIQPVCRLLLLYLYLLQVDKGCFAAEMGRTGIIHSGSYSKATVRPGFYFQNNFYETGVYIP